MTPWRLAIDLTIQTFQCLFVLLAAVLYRIIFFIIFMSASVGPATLTCHLYTMITGREPYPEVQPALCMLLISCWAEFSVTVERRFCTNIMEHLVNRFPGVMSFGRFTVHFALYMAAFCELYIAFEKVHTIPEPHKKRRFELHQRINLHEEITSEDERLAISNANEQWNVTIFLFSLGYLIFVTARNFYKDLLLVVRNLPSVSFTILNNWIIRIAFAIVHAFVNLFYFLPCLAIAYTSNNYKTSGLTAYFQLTFTAAMAGMIAALFELNRPWPQQRGRLPFLFYEVANNIFGKNLLAHILVVGILYFFYRPKCHPKVLESMFDSTNRDVIYFCLIVAFATLHTVKFGVHAVLSLAHDYDQRMLEINNAVAEIPDIGNGGSSRNGSRSHQGGTVSNTIGEGGMCARCISNVLNNNSYLNTAPVVNQTNNANSCVEPQGGGTSAAKDSSEEKKDSTDDENNKTTETVDKVESDQKPVHIGNDVDRKESCDAVNNEISESPRNDCQLHIQSTCINPQVDLEILNEHRSKVHVV